MGKRGATVLNVTSTPDSTPKIGSLTCPFCKGTHKLSACHVLKNAKVQSYCLSDEARPLLSMPRCYAQNSRL